ncbi:MAG TPA: hypothetical protein VJ327_11215 [Patescibacteria group bacterium]|nr:hypothetical protein [Patescibacteria group bacterium]
MARSRPSMILGDRTKQRLIERHLSRWRITWARFPYDSMVYFAERNRANFPLSATLYVRMDTSIPLLPWDTNKEMREVLYCRYGYAAMDILNRLAAHTKYCTAYRTRTQASRIDKAARTLVALMNVEEERVTAA